MLEKQIERIAKESKDQIIANKFLSRLADGRLTRDENPFTHFCVYFAAFDQNSQRIFFGHHKKSGLWLFNGGHIDKGETVEKALDREISEEWGLKIPLLKIGEPKLLTITKINNPTKQTCTKHFDIWFFVPVKKVNFNPDEDLLDKEFYKTGWFDIGGANKLAIDPNTLKALSVFAKDFA